MKILSACTLVTITCFAIALFAGETPKSSTPKSSTNDKTDRAQAAFDKLSKSLEGDWEGKGTKGWTEKSSYRTIATGSVIMEIFYGDKPSEWMATMYHMDGKRLMLTHYCMAKNQPRLVATDISDDSNQIT